MGRMAARVLFLASAIFTPVHLYGQDVFVEFLIEGPRISRTAFTNRESIELAYTVRWMDGYEPIRDQLKPQFMDFGILELDPYWAEKNDIKNERKFEKENFFDITYHLWYMAEKKDEIIIPGSKFPYRRVQPGDSQVQYFLTDEFRLNYGTVLTSDAEDIKEEFDAGSYQGKAMFWKISAGIVILIGIAGGLVLILFKSMPAPLAENAAGASVSQVVDIRVNPSEVANELKANIADSNLGAVCNGLKDLIGIYVPGVKSGMATKDMALPILSVPYKWEREQFLRVHTALCDIEDHLFINGNDVDGKVAYHMSNLLAVTRTLRPWSVYWHRLWFRISRKIKRLFLPLNKLWHMLAWVTVFIGQMAAKSFVFLKNKLRIKP